MRRTVILVSFLSLFYASQALALSVSFIPDAGTMLKNLSSQIPSLMRFVTALSFVMGFFFIYKGLMEFKKFGDQRTQMSGEHHIAGPLMFLFVGAALVYLPESVWVGMNTLWGHDINPYAWQTQSTDGWSYITDAVFMLIQLVGAISFIRGLVLLTHLTGGHSAQPGTFGRAMAHIIAGVLCINLYGFLQVISNTLGILWQ